MNKLKYVVIISFFLFAPFFAIAQVTGGNTTGVGGGNTQLPNPISGDIKTLEELVVLILEKVVIPVGSIVIVFMIIFTGFKFVMARGNPDAISDAKRMLLYVLIGAAILLGSTVIAGAISGTLCDIAPALPNCRVGPPQIDGSF